MDRESSAVGCWKEPLFGWPCQFDWWEWQACVLGRLRGSSSRRCWFTYLDLKWRQEVFSSYCQSVKKEIMLLHIKSNEMGGWLMYLLQCHVNTCTHQLVVLKNKWQSNKRQRAWKKKKRKANVSCTWQVVGQWGRPLGFFITFSILYLMSSSGL